MQSKAPGLTNPGMPHKGATMETLAGSDTLALAIILVPAVIGLMLFFRMLR